MRPGHLKLRHPGPRGFRRLVPFMDVHEGTLPRAIRRLMTGSISSELKLSPLLMPAFPRVASSPSNSQREAVRLAEGERCEVLRKLRLVSAYPSGRGPSSRA